MVQHTCCTCLGLWGPETHVPVWFYLFIGPGTLTGQIRGPLNVVPVRSGLLSPLLTHALTGSIRDWQGSEKWGWKRRNECETGALRVLGQMGSMVQVSADPPHQGILRREDRHLLRLAWSVYIVFRTYSGISVTLSRVLPRDAMLTRYMLSACVRPSVCLSVRHKSQFYREG